MNRTVAEHWEEFERMTVHPQASDAQRNSTRHAFYAGALIMWELLACLGSEAENEEAGVAVIERLRREVFDYGEKVIDQGKNN